MNYPKYMDDIKIFANNEKELETSMQTIRIYNWGWNLALKMWLADK